MSHDGGPSLGRGGLYMASVREDSASREPAPEGVTPAQRAQERADLLRLICKKFYVAPDSEQDLIEILDQMRYEQEEKLAAVRRPARE